MVGKIEPVSERVREREGGGERQTVR